MYAERSGTAAFTLRRGSAGADRGGRGTHKAGRKSLKLSIKGPRWIRLLAHPVTKTLLALLIIALVAGGWIFIDLYNHYSRLIDARLNGSIFAHPSILFAAPEQIYTGEKITLEAIAEHLRRAGYNRNSASPVGIYSLRGNQLTIQPGPEAFVSPEPVQVQFQGGQISAINDPTTGLQLSSYALEPEVLTSLYDTRGVKRQLLHYHDLPPELVDAVLATEDQYFFQHGAIDYPRVLAAAWRDLRSGRKEQGASTLAMQVARNFFLTPKKQFRRKLEEMLIAYELEDRFTKQQIFTLYANEVYEGQHGTYQIRGFGEAARAYFGVSVRHLSLPECALLAGLLHGPSLDNPYRHPKRAVARRNFVLKMMHRDGFISRAREQEAAAQPLKLAPLYRESGDAPYFVDMVQDQLAHTVPRRELLSQSFHIYTTLDPDLQRFAVQAVQDGLQAVNARLAQRARRERLRRVRTRHGWRWLHPKPEVAQAALIALDPHTGDIRALVGGSNYAISQLNHILASRPTGSIFKPFVYAVAMNTAIDGSPQVFTEMSTLMDQRTVFPGGYSPTNFRNEYMGQVTVRQALEHSLNNATISLAMQVGLGKIAALAKAAGIRGLEATPAMAIGSYDASPWEMAQAYTLFANAGVLVQPRMIYQVENAQRQVILRNGVKSQALLDPRTAFLVDDLMESVVNHGTGAGLRAMGLTQPIAGKTGTSHDGWFAGFTNTLECVVWVGLDDYHNLNIQGAHSALPIWGEFMKQALAQPAYSNVQPFQPPAGVVAATLDKASLRLVTPLCPSSDSRVDYFIAGTQPTQGCGVNAVTKLPGAIVNGFRALFGQHPAKPPAPAPAAAAAPPPAMTSPSTQAAIPASASAPKKKKKGFWGKVFGGIFGGGKKKPHE